MSPLKEDPRVRELLDRVAELDARLAVAVRERNRADADARGCLADLLNLEEFIEDVQRGIRDLSEYGEVCRRAGLVA